MTAITSGYFTSFDGYPIYYESRGRGEPIVLIYGIACLMNHWHFQVESLSKTNQVITFDLRGHHKSFSKNSAANYSLEALANDLAALSRSLSLPPAHFIGHSFGAQILIKAYELSPHIFKSLVFVNGFAKNPLKGMFGLDLSETVFGLIREAHKISPGAISRLWRAAIDNPIAMISAGVLGGFNLRQTQFKDIEIYSRGVAHFELDVLIRYFEDMVSFQGEEIASQIKCPTLIISGENDMVTPQKFQRELNRLISGSELCVVPYGSHCTQLDFPDYTNLKLKEFISKL